MLSVSLYKIVSKKNAIDTVLIGYVNSLLISNFDLLYLKVKALGSNKLAFYLDCKKLRTLLKYLIVYKIF